MKKVVSLAIKAINKIRNTVLLEIYLKSGVVESLNIELDEEFLEKKWAFKKTNCYVDGFSGVKKQEEIDLSIIVPLYNSEKFLETCVRRLLDQKTQYVYEIVLVNDGSDDRTYALAKTYQRQNGEKIRVITQPNGGISSARNVGIEESKGKYLGFVDHDDLVDEYYVEKLMAAAYKEDADIVKAAFVDIWNGKTKGAQEQIDIVINGNMEEKLFDYKSYIFPGVYKRKLFEHVRFPVGFWYEDMIVRTLLYRQSRKFVHIGDVIYYKRFHKDNASFVVWNPKSYKCLEHLYMVVNLIEENKKMGLPVDAWFYQCILRELSFILSLRSRRLDTQTKQMIFLKACDIITELYSEKYDEFLTDKNKMWQRVFLQKEYKLWLLLSGHY